MKLAIFPLVCLGLETTLILSPSGGALALEFLINLNNSDNSLSIGTILFLEGRASNSKSLLALNAKLILSGAGNCNTFSEATGMSKG